MDNIKITQIIDETLAGWAVKGLSLSDAINVAQIMDTHLRFVADDLKTEVAGKSLTELADKIPPAIERFNQKITGIEDL